MITNTKIYNHRLILIKKNYLIHELNFFQEILQT